MINDLGGFDASNIKEVKELIRYRYAEDGEFPIIHLAKKTQSKLNAKDMIGNYIEQVCSEYENQEEFCLDAFTKEDYEEIQNVLDRINTASWFDLYSVVERIYYGDYKTELLAISR